MSQLMQQGQSGQTGFDDLPPELRNMVYEYLSAPFPGSIKFGEPLPKVPPIL